MVKVGTVRVLAVSAVLGAGVWAQEPAPNPALTTIKTICVETFAGDPTIVPTVKELAISALFGVAAGVATGAAAAIGAAAGGRSEALYSKESQTHASISARLVGSDGVVVWAHTQESAGGKVKGPFVDAVERAVRLLLRDIERAEASSNRGNHGIAAARIDGLRPWFLPPETALTPDR